MSGPSQALSEVKVSAEEPLCLRFFVHPAPSEQISKPYHWFEQAKSNVHARTSPHSHNLATVVFHQKKVSLSQTIWPKHVPNPISNEAISCPGDDSPHPLRGQEVYEHKMNIHEHANLGIWRHRKNRPPNPLVTH